MHMFSIEQRISSSGRQIKRKSYLNTSSGKRLSRHGCLKSLTWWNQAKVFRKPGKLNQQWSGDNIIRCTRSSVSMHSEVSVVQQGWKVNDKTLDATVGDLKLRLDTDFHYPILPGINKYSPCRLCRWALQDGKERHNQCHGASISTCDRCTVLLCLSCFKPFHTITNVDKFKPEIKKNVN